MDHAVTVQVFKVQKDVESQMTGGPCCNSACVQVQKDVVSQVTGGPCYNNAGVQSAERCGESGDRWTML